MSLRWPGELPCRSQPHWPFCSERCVQRSGAWPPSWRSALTSPSPGRRWTHHCEMCRQQSVSRSVPPCPNILRQTRGWRAVGGVSKAHVKMKFCVWSFTRANRWLPAPEERHHIADDLVLFVHSQVSWLDSLWRRAQSAHLQPRMRRKAGIYKRLISPTPTEHKNGNKNVGMKVEEWSGWFSHVCFPIPNHVEVKYISEVRNGISSFCFFVTCAFNFKEWATRWFSLPICCNVICSPQGWEGGTVGYEITRAR